MGEDVEDFIVQTSSKTQQMIKDYTATAFNPEGVDVLDENGNLKDTYEILLEISKVYKQIQEDDKKFGTNRANALVEYIAGKNRSNIAASILNNPELLESVYESSKKSQGSALEENEKYLDSIEGRLNVLKNRWQEIWATEDFSNFIKDAINFAQNLLDSGQVESISNALSGLIKVLDTLVNDGKLLNATFMALSAKGILKFVNTGVGAFKKLSATLSEASQLGNAYKNTLNITKGFGVKSLSELGDGGLYTNLTTPGIDKNTLVENTSAIEGYRKAIDGLTADQAMLTLKVNGCTEAQARQILGLKNGTIAIQSFGAEEAEAAIKATSWAASTAVITEANFDLILSEQLLNDNQLQIIKNKLGLVSLQNGEVVATKELTEARLMEALTDAKVDDANKKLIASYFTLKNTQQNLNSQMTIGQKVSGLFTYSIKNLGAILRSTFVSSAILMGISAIVSAISQAVDKAIITKKEAKELSETFSSTFSSMQKSHAETVKTFAEIDDEFKTLSKGVDALGRNVGLTDDEFDRYHEITSIIDQNIPNLVQGYTDQGDAIIKLTGNVTSLTDAYKEMQRQEAYNAYNAVDDKGTRVIDGVYKNAQNVLSEVSVKKSEAENLQAELTRLLSYDYKQLQDIYTEAFNTGNIGLIGILDSAGFENSTEEEYDEIHKNLLAQYSETQSLIRQYDSDLKATATQLSQSAQEYANSLSSYWDELDDSQRSLFNSFLSGINDTNALDDISKIFDVNLSKEGDMNRFISDMINIFKTLDSNSIEQINTRFNLETQFNNGEISLGEYESKISEFTNWINNIPNDGLQKVISLLFDFTINDDDRKETIEKQKQHIKDLMGSNWKDEYADQFSAEELELAMKITIDEPSMITVQERLEQLGVGGSVDLNLRPNIDASELKKAGWGDPFNPNDLGEGQTATVYSSTYSNAEGTKYVNFTPIIVDKYGNYCGVLSPQELQEYAEGVIEGTREDNLNLQIGTSFDSVEEAEAAAEEIHKLHELMKMPQNALPLIFNPLFNAMDFDKVKDEIAKLMNQPPVEVEVKPKVTAVDAVDSMNKAKTAITSLESLYDQVVKLQDSDNQATGFADPALLNSVESAFEDFVQEAKDGSKDVTELNLALKEFEQTMVEQPNNTKAAQDAINKLITAYIDQTDIIKNLKKENAEWSIAQLKAYGVTNAEDVVMSRLSNTTQQLVKDFKSATNALNNLTGAQEDNYDVGSMNSVQDQLNSMFSTQVGDQEITPDFDPSWIIQNLDLLKKAANGSAEAMWRVQQEAAKRITAQIEINAPSDSEVNDIQNQINGLINSFDISDVEVGTSLDTSPMIKGLNALVDAGKITRDSMNAILASIGVEPQVTYKDIPISVNMQGAIDALNAAAKTSMGNYYNAKYMIPQIQSGNLTGNVRIPVIDYVATSKGVGATYAPSGGKSSSGGGGGGGGGGGSSSEPNKPKDEAEETFDWIEVAIQRIEEEIARLDKVVGNSYDIWIKRNEALLKEMEKTKEEIKAQQLAQKEYLRNANLVKVNNGKGLNDDDYGENDQLVKAQDQKLLDEAKKAWATGEYQRKVQQGQMTDDDIERIANHFLTDTINAYREMYEKSVQAGDAVQDLKIKLGDLARTNFDHLKTEAEETLSYFESYSSLIDARISRTEEKGYFVSRNYYDNLVANEKKSLETLRDEYDGLIKKRDEAVTSGYISNGSEEWHSMNQEILAVAQSIEEATNKVFEFANQIRQIDWDVFDFLQDRIGKVNDEFEFLIDLLDNQKLYDDWGMFNERGWADTALHASKYNTYMQQALDYAEQRKKIEDELDKDKADKNLIERREELIQLQQESIKNAYAEKDAVKSLVEEGYIIALYKFI